MSISMNTAADADDITDEGNNTGVKTKDVFGDVGRCQYNHQLIISISPTVI